MGETAFAIEELLQELGEAEPIEPNILKQVLGAPPFPIPGNANEAYALWRDNPTDENREILAGELLKFAQQYVTRHFGKHYDIYEDCPTDAVMKALTKVDKYAPTASFTSWFRRIIMNTCRDTWRRRQNSGWVSACDENPALAVPAAHEQNLDAVALVQEYLSHLNDEERAVVELRINGYKFKEIAEMKRDKLSAVKMRWLRALEKMRRASRKKM